VNRLEGRSVGGGRTSADMNDHMVQEALALCDAALARA
jgi:hypothetical protein